MTQISDAEVVRLIKSGVRQLCDEATSSWWSGKFSADNDEVRKNVERWKQIRQRAIELIDSISH